MFKNTMSISSNNIIIMLMLTLAIVTISLVLNYFFRMDLFFLGLKSVKFLQQNDTDFKKVFYNIITILGDLRLIIAIIVAELVLVKEKARVFTHVIFLSFSFYIIQLLKNLFHEARPFWVDGISQNQNGCSVDYGHPSRHSFIGIVFYEPLLLDIIGIRNKPVALSLWICIFSAVIFTRVYLGVHSIDQVQLSAVLSLSFLVFYRYKIQELIYRLIEKIVRKKNFAYYLIAISICFIILILLPLLAFLINMEKEQVASNFLDNIKAKCNQAVTTRILNGNSFVATSAGFIGFGVLFALMILANQRKSLHYLSGRWEFSSLKSMLIWIISALTFTLAPYFLLKHSVTALKTDYIVTYFINVLRDFLLGFSVIAHLIVLQLAPQIISFEEQVLNEQSLEK